MLSKRNFAIRVSVQGVPLRAMQLELLTLKKLRWGALLLDYEVAVVNPHEN
jgi:hypothetical protein